MLVGFLHFKTKVVFIELYICGCLLLSYLLYIICCIAFKPSKDLLKQ